jgi:hypothetical protein
MEGYWQIIIIGIYTLAYLVVFIIQSSQIKKIKEINESMKAFMDIFKIDEVKKYVEMKHETVMMKVDNMLANSEKLREAAKHVVLEKNDEIIEMNRKQIGGDHMELIMFVLNVLKTVPLSDREELINKNLPKTKRFIVDILNDYENNAI